MTGECVQISPFGRNDRGVRADLSPVQVGVEMTSAVAAGNPDHALNRRRARRQGLASWVHDAGHAHTPPTAAGDDETMNATRWTAAAVAAALALAGCASGPRLTDVQKHELYRSHAGEPVDSFSYLGGITGWTPLGDEALAVWTRPSEAWLLDLHGPCNDLRFAHAIGLTGSMSRVHASFDKVLVHSPGGMDFPCHIRQIRPLDVKALRATEKELREASVQAREADG